ncbi:hypothetical protein GCM10020229_53940 [Kitasatospora albolonga]
MSALKGGEVASYIPQLAKADPDDFGIAITSMAGRRYKVGKADTPFTIQSVSKPFVYALALSDLGPEEMLRRVGAEPSGEAFNAISLEPHTGRPANPMVNAGAIATTALVRAADPGARSARILDRLSAFAGRRLDHDEEVYASESASGDRNRALAYLMRAAGSLVDDPYAVTDTYFRQCAVRVTAAEPRGDGRDAGHRGAQPRHRRTGRQPAGGDPDAGRDGHLRNVRRCRGVAVERRAAGQERCGGRADRVQPGPLRRRRLQSAAGRGGQLRPGRGGADRDVLAVRAAPHARPGAHDRHRDRHGARGALRP